MDDVRGSISISSAGFMELNNGKKAPYKFLEDAAAGMVSLGKEPGSVSGYSEGEKTKLAAGAQVAR